MLAKKCLLYLIARCQEMLHTYKVKRVIVVTVDSAAGVSDLQQTQSPLIVSSWTSVDESFQ